MTKNNTYSINIIKISERKPNRKQDVLAVEEPLEIKLAFGPIDRRTYRSLAITMRTPGNDRELAVGFLFSEGLIGSIKDIITVRHVGQALSEEAKDNVLLVELAPDVPIDFDQLSRHFYTSSSCGVCGKTSIEMIRTVIAHFPRAHYPIVPSDIFLPLPENLRSAQTVFEDTGGIHAAGLFDSKGKLLFLQEDVGRHNALDKVLGEALQKKLIPLRDHILLVSGRISFELVQKALMAGIPIMAAVGAPSSLAVQMAEEYGMTIIGFLRDGKFNIYCGGERVEMQN